MTSYNTGATNSSDTSATVTLAIPAGVNVGDVMVMSLTCFNENATTPTIAFSGAGGAWTLVPVSAGINPEISSGGGIFQYGFAYYRVATAGDQGATLTITGSGSGFSSATTWWAVAMAAYTGASVAAPVDVAGGVNNIGDQDVYTITTRSLTTGVSGDWAVYLFPGGPGVGTTLGGPGTIRQTIVSDAGIGSVISDSNGSVGAAGTSIGGGNFTVTGNSGGVWLTSFTIGLAPPAQPAPALLAEPGQAWRRHFQHRQQVPQPQPPAVPVSVAGAVSALTLAAPAGSVTAGATVAGAVAGLTLAAPAGTASVGTGVTGTPAALTLAAPAGTVTAGASVAGAVSALALAAPAGTVTAGATVAGAVAGLTLAAPAGTVVAGTAVPVNQWAGDFATPPVFGPSPPGIQSLVIPLDAGSSVGGGSGTPTAGNWLFVSVGWNQAAGLPPVTIAVGDDTHQWFRPAAPSLSTGSTRTTIWYQPNIVPPGFVYVAPSGYTDGMSVLVTEVTGLGIWDEVVALATNSASASTSLSLAAGAPGGPAFMIASGTGDLSTAGTALTHSGWTTLSTVTAVNGTDHTGDTILASACITTSSAQTVAVTGSTEDLSGMILAVLQSAPSPVPGGLNPSWPYVKYEAGFGSGYLTPPDQITWTDLLQFANGMRLRSWDESTGPQYELDALEASEVGTSLDNPDGALSPFNASSAWYPDIVPGTPMRIRAIAPGGSRWHVISRNAETWPQTWDDYLRGETNSKLTDLWSIVNRPCPTPYRAEVLNDLPYAWWPMDDFGVNNATTLVNAAPGNTNPLNIITSPNGLSVSGTIPPSTSTTYSASQTFSSNTGWMYGDPVSASWQQDGNGSGTHGRYLSCNDTGFPPLAGGVTIEAWSAWPFAATGSGSDAGPITQPSGTLVLWQIGSATAPFARLQITSGGAIQLITWNGSTPTTNAIYSSTNLLDGSVWWGAIVTMTQTAWTVTLNGGIVAQVSGTASMSSAWTWITALAGTGNSGMPPTSGTLSGVGNAALAHLSVYPSVLPAGRQMAHWMAAYTAFGQLPAPSLSAQTISATGGFSVYGPDGNQHTVSLVSGAAAAALATATGGGYTSAPSTPETVTVFTDSSGNEAYFWLTSSGLAPEYAIYDAAGAGNEKLHSTTPAGFQLVTSFGSGAAPPTSASALGDGAGQRIERLLQAGGVTVPARCIDPSPTAIVAGLDSGGQASGSNITNITASDSSFLFVDNLNMLCCWDRPHLAAQTAIWQLGDGNGQIPYYLAASAQANADPQRIFNDIAITQYDASQAAAAAVAGDSTGSGETSGGLVYAPDSTRYAAVKASQLQNGYCPLQNGTTSYLQSGAEIQAQANFLFDQYGVVRQRIENLEVHAENHPATWDFVLGINTGDLIEVFFDPPGQPTFSGTFRATRIERKIEFTEDGVEGSVTLIADYEPSSYWT